MDIRYQPGKQLKINLLATRELLSGHIVRFKGRTATIRVDRPVALGAPVRIDFEDSLLLGEASSCEARTDEYIITIHVTEAVPVLSDLARLVSCVMAGGRPVPVENRAAAELFTHKQKGGDPFGPPPRIVVPLVR